MWKGADGGDAYVKGNHSTACGGDAGDSTSAPGGPGGRAHVTGNNSHAVGGRGGRGGVGPGGPGGDAHVVGDNAGYFGGDGGEADQEDGRGGRGGSAYGMHFLGLSQRRARMKLPYGEPNNFPGRGGDKPDSIQHMARRLIVEDLKLRYFIEYRLSKADPHHIWYDREEVPMNWINECLKMQGHQWCAEIVADEYVFLDNVQSKWIWKKKLRLEWLSRLLRR